MNYAHRALALTYLLLVSYWAISAIGEISHGRVLSWTGSWAFISLIAVSMWLGWQARGEHGT